MALTFKRRRFVLAYLGTHIGNATQAAIAAGYSERSARSIGSRLLTFPDVRAAIAAEVNRVLGGPRNGEAG